MKIDITKLVIMSGLLIQMATMTQGFASGKKAPSLSAHLENIPKVIEDEILSYLNIEQLHEIRESKAFSSTTLLQVDVLIQREINKYLMEFIPLPEVTNNDVNHLRHYLGRYSESSIKKPIPSFRAAQTKTSVGLYRAVMGRFPSLDRAQALCDLNGVHYYDLFSYGAANLFSSLRKEGEHHDEPTKAGIIDQWEADPDLPLTFTTGKEDFAFAKKLGKLTGRRFRIMSDAENEYSIRGRRLIDKSPSGNIIENRFFFADNYNTYMQLISSYAWPQSCGFEFERDWIPRVHENPPGYENVPKHPFGLTQVIGSVWVRSSEGVLRGNSEYYHRDRFSSPVVGNYNDFRLGGVGSRLAEDI